jgi:hypothetical protein
LYIISLLFFPKVTKFGKYTPFPEGTSRTASMSPAQNTFNCARENK